MENVRIAFVVLHYQAIEETRKCIETIEKKVGIEEYKIIVVDNKSPDNSGSLLLQEFANDKKVDIILNTKNIGFARGNNAGFMWAKNNYNPKYIVLSNNDIQLVTDNFYAEIEKEYLSSEFAVLGPLILTADGRYDSNPISLSRISREQIKNQIKDAKFHLWLNKVGLLSFYDTLSIIKKRIRSSTKKETVSFSYHEGCTLHGSFFIFSKKYINSFDGLNPNTFMYKEEYILHATVESAGLKMVYSPNIFVYHKEDASTDSIVIRSKEKWQFVFSNIIKSSEVLLQVYDDLGMK